MDAFSWLDESLNHAPLQEHGLLRTLIDYLPDAIYIKDTASRFILGNLATARLMGAQTPAELVGKTDSEYYPPELAAKFYAEEQALLRSGEPSINRTEWICDAAGRERWLSTTKIPLRQEEGAIVGLLGISRDLTEQRRAEQALQSSEKRFRTLIEQSADAVALIDGEGRITYVSPTAGRILGVPVDDLIGQHSFSSLHPDDMSRARKVLAEVLENRDLTPTLQLRYRGWDGEWHWIEVTVRNLIAEPSVGAIVVNYRDVTARKQMEDALQDKVVALQVLAEEKERLFEETRRRADEFAALYETTRDLAAEHELPALLRTIVERAAALLHTAGGIMFLYDPAQQHLRLAVSKLTPSDVGFIIRPGEGMAGRVAHTRQPLIVDDYQTWEHRLPDVPLTAALQVPMLYSGELIGVLDVSEVTATTRHFTATDVELLSLFAGQAAAAVHNARLFQETRRRLVELEALNRVSSALRIAQTIDEMLLLLLSETLAVLDTTAGQIAFFEGATAEQHASVQQGWFEETPRTARAGDGIAGQVFLTGRTYVTREFRSDPLTSEFARDRVPAGWGGALVPLRVGAEIIGILAVSVQLPRELTPDELQLLSALAEIAGGAIHRRRLYEEARRAAEELTLAYDTTIEGWSRALDLRDQETEGHTRRVTEMTLRLARVLDLPAEELVHLRRGALLHDIGKMGIPDGILLKPGPLTEAEWTIMRQHPVIAYELLAPIDYLAPSLDIPSCHHERWDGSGYPRGLKGTQIPLAARLFALVDVWDALRSDRPYRPAWPDAQVREHLRSLAGIYFDPQLVEPFLKLIEE